jgi:hypothetical protein
MIDERHEILVEGIEGCWWTKEEYQAGLYSKLAKKYHREFLRQRAIDDLIDNGIIRDTYLNDNYPLTYNNLFPIEQERIDEIVRRHICKDLMTQSYNLGLIEGILLQLVNGLWKVTVVPGPCQSWSDGQLCLSQTYLNKIKKLSLLKIQGVLGTFSQVFLEMQGLILEEEEE